MAQKSTEWSPDVRVIVKPRLKGTKMLLRCIYVSQKYPHIYTLSISTGKNQSLKIRGALYIPTYEYNYKVIPKCATILQEYYIIDSRNCENTKRCTSMNCTKGAHEPRNGNSRAEQGPWKDRVSYGLPMIHATAALL